MSSVPFFKESIASIKQALRDEFPDVGSSHISEALAAALGYRSNAALLATLPPVNSDPDYVLLDIAAFEERLAGLGHMLVPDFEFEQLPIPTLLNTRCSRASEYSYKSMRALAWRNLLVAATNEGLRRRLFSLKLGDNRWNHEGARGGEYRKNSAIFEFTLPIGLPALGYVADAGFGELAIHAAVYPGKNSKQFLGDYQAGFRAGDAFGATWLERERGAWLQSSTDSFKCRNALVEQLALMEVRAAGYGDRGRVIM